MLAIREAAIADSIQRLRKHKMVEAIGKGRDITLSIEIAVILGIADFTNRIGQHKIA